MKKVESLKNIPENCRVYHQGEHTVCATCGIPTARFVTRGGYVEFSPFWDSSEETIKHVLWFLREVREWRDVSYESLCKFVQHKGFYFINVVNFDDNIYCVTEQVILLRRTAPYGAVFLMENYVFSPTLCGK